MAAAAAAVQGTGKGESTQQVLQTGWGVDVT